MESSCLLMADAAMHEFESGLLFALTIVISGLVIAAISYYAGRLIFCDDHRASEGGLAVEAECDDEEEWYDSLMEIHRHRSAEFANEMLAKHKAEQEFWSNREVLVELWEPNREGGVE